MELLDLIGQIVGGVGYVLDTPGALTRGALAGRMGERVDGRELLETWGVLDENRAGLDAGDVAGFGAEMLLDPLNLLSGGAIGGLKAANKGIDAANASSKAMRAAGAMPEEIAKLTSVVDEAGNPLRTYHGTPHAFDKPDFDRLDPNALMGKGYYATDTSHVASEYTEKGAGWDALPAESQAELERLGRHRNKIAEIHGRLMGDAGGYSLLDDEPLPASPKIKRAEDALLRVGGRMESLETLPQNVRMQYLDIRNPFDADASLDPQEGLSLLQQTLRDVAADPRARSSIANAEFAAKRGIPVQGVDIIEALKASGVVPGEGLRGAGYDGITHRGGMRMGNDAHQVYIATDPSQIYSPYVAPALQDRRSYNPLLAMLAGYNAGQLPEDLR